MCTFCTQNDDIDDDNNDVYFASASLNWIQYIYLYHIKSDSSRSIELVTRKELIAPLLSLSSFLLHLNELLQTIIFCRRVQYNNVQLLKSMKNARKFISRIDCSIWFVSTPKVFSNNTFSDKRNKTEAVNEMQQQKVWKWHRQWKKVPHSMKFKHDTKYEFDT